LNELLLKLSQEQNFQDLTELSDKKKLELYDKELVLRFIAFLNNADDVNDNTENYLNKFMEETVSNPDFDYESYGETFSNVLNLINSLDDAKVFRNDNNLFVPAQFEGIMIGVAQNYDKYENDLDALKD